MKKSRPLESDVPVRRPFAALRSDFDPQHLAAEADVAGLEPFMEATIAAAMIIAHADGSSDLVERRRILSLFRANRLLQGFSADDISREIHSHSEAFAFDTQTALRRAHDQIANAGLTARQFDSMIGVCVAVLEADGVRHPAEQAALDQIIVIGQRSLN